MIVPLSEAPHVRRETQRMIYMHFGTDTLPPLDKIFVKVVSDGYVLVGTYTLEDDDLESSGCPGPWITDLVVKTQFRGQGYGTELIKDAKRRVSSPLFAWCANPMVFRLFLDEGFAFVSSSAAKDFVTNVAIFIYDELVKRDSVESAGFAASLVDSRGGSRR